MIANGTSFFRIPKAIFSVISVFSTIMSVPGYSEIRDNPNNLCSLYLEVRVISAFYPRGSILYRLSVLSIGRLSASSISSLHTECMKVCYPKDLRSIHAICHKNNWMYF